VDGTKNDRDGLAGQRDGVRIVRRGMTGPATTVAELALGVPPAGRRGVLTERGGGDYCTGPVAPGVFGSAL